MAGLWRNSSAGKSCSITFVMTLQISQVAFLSARPFSTDSKTFLSDVINGCHGITSHLMPVSTLLISVPSSTSRDLSVSPRLLSSSPW